MAELATPLFDPKPRQWWVRDMVSRSRRRLSALDPSMRDELLEDALYHERKRLDRAEPEPGERERLDALARALVRGSDRERLDAGLAVVAAWADEIHGRFSRRVYKVATRIMPKALTGLLSAKPTRLRDWDLDIQNRIRITGDVPFIQELCREATVVLAPTHVSNLDSPLIGMALYDAGLPPFVYGAGLNLFSNPIMGWWLRRLGAYTVDRRKRAKLYKMVLKDYSVGCISGGLHSLFFPGGTRARDGRVETHVKKGLLGTGVQAWQENLDGGRPNPDVYVVPLTLSYQLVLEASSLIDDHLADAGKQRYIIDDDEFSNPRQVATFARRALDLDASCYLHFGQPIDCLGNPVPIDAAERKQASERRLSYVCDREGEVQWDSQRDRIYTDRLADRLAQAYGQGTTVMSTHVAAWAAWSLLQESRGSTDPFRLVRIDRHARYIPRGRYLHRLDHVVHQVHEGAKQGRWRQALPLTGREALDTALDRFAIFHKTRALASEGDNIVIEDPHLCLYYRNRLDFAGLEV